MAPNNDEQANFIRIQEALVALGEKRGLAKDAKAHHSLDVEEFNLRKDLRESLGRIQGGQQGVGTTFLAFSPALDISVLRQVYPTRHNGFVYFYRGLPA